MPGGNSGTILSFTWNSDGKTFCKTEGVSENESRKGLWAWVRGMKQCVGPDFFNINDSGYDIRTLIQTYKPLIVTFSTQEGPEKHNYLHSDYLPGKMRELGYVSLYREKLKDVGSWSMLSADQKSFADEKDIGKPCLRFSIFVPREEEETFVNKTKDRSFDKSDNARFIQDKISKCGAIGIPLSHPKIGDITLVAAHYPTSYRVVKYHGNYRAETDVEGGKGGLARSKAFLNALVSKYFLIGGQNQGGIVPDHVIICGDFGIDYGFDPEKQGFYDQLNPNEFNLLEGSEETGKLRPTWSMNPNRDESCADAEFDTEEGRFCYQGDVIGIRDRVLYNSRNGSTQVLKCALYQAVSSPVIDTTTHNGTLALFNIEAMGIRTLMPLINRKANINLSIVGTDELSPKSRKEIQKNINHGLEGLNRGQRSPSGRKIAITTSSVSPEDTAAKKISAMAREIKSLEAELFTVRQQRQGAGPVMSPQPQAGSPLWMTPPPVQPGASPQPFAQLPPIPTQFMTSGLSPGGNISPFMIQTGGVPPPPQQLLTGAPGLLPPPPPPPLPAQLLMGGAPGLPGAPPPPPFAPPAGGNSPPPLPFAFATPGGSGGTPPFSAPGSAFSINTSGVLPPGVPPRFPPSGGGAPGAFGSPGAFGASSAAVPPNLTPAVPQTIVGTGSGGGGGFPSGLVQTGAGNADNSLSTMYGEFINPRPFMYGPPAEPPRYYDIFSDAPGTTYGATPSGISQPEITDGVWNKISDDERSLAQKIYVDGRNSANPTLFTTITEQYIADIIRSYFKGDIELYLCLLDFMNREINKFSIVEGGSIKNNLFYDNIPIDTMVKRTNAGQPFYTDPTGFKFVIIHTGTDLHNINYTVTVNGIPRASHRVEGFGKSGGTVGPNNISTIILKSSTGQGKNNTTNPAAPAASAVPGTPATPAAVPGTPPAPPTCKPISGSRDVGGNVDRIITFLKAKRPGTLDAAQFEAWLKTKIKSDIKIPVCSLLGNLLQHSKGNYSIDNTNSTAPTLTLNGGKHKGLIDVMVDHIMVGTVNPYPKAVVSDDLSIVYINACGTDPNVPVEGAGGGGNKKGKGRGGGGRSPT